MTMKTLLIIGLLAVGCATPTQFRKDSIALRAENQLHRETKRNAVDELKQQAREDALAKENLSQEEETK
jgi:hypothetical protein